jgi:hypothetical protein
VLRPWDLMLVVPNLGIVLTGLRAAAENTGGSGVDLVGPIAGTGIVGVILLMLMFRFKIMPTYVYDQMVAEKDAACSQITTEKDRQIAERDARLVAAGEALKDANEIYVQQVIPTMTRALDVERELLDLRREEQADRRATRKRT